LQTFKNGTNGLEGVSPFVGLDCIMYHDVALQFFNRAIKLLLKVFIYLSENYFFINFLILWKKFI